MIKFSDYYGNDVWIAPERVLYVRDGGSGSRGVAAEIYLDDGKHITVNDQAEWVVKKLEEAKNHG